MDRKKGKKIEGQKKGIKILIISSCVQLHKGGHPFTVLNMAINMARSGFDISFITAIPQDQKLLGEMKKAGISVYSMPIKDNPLFPVIFGIFSLLLGYVIAKRKGIQVIQVHAPSSAIIGFILKLFTNSKLSMVFHGFWRNEKVKDLSSGIKEPISNMLLAIEKAVYGRIDAFIVMVNTDIYTKYLTSLGASKDKILPTCCGPPTFRFTANSHDPKEYEKLRSKFDKRVIFVGKFDGLKGQDLLIKAIPKIIRNIPSIGFVFVGDGSEKKKCETLAESLKVKMNTVFLGSRDDVPELLKIADIAVSHLSQFLEGIGTAQREIVYFKIPLVTKHDSITREYFGDTVSYVNPNNADELSSAICNLLANKEYAKKMSEEAYRILEEKFSWEKCVADMMNAYERISFLPVNQEYNQNRK